MREYLQKNRLQSRTLDNNRYTSKRNSIADILQAYRKTKIVDGKVLDEKDKPAQMKMENVIQMNVNLARVFRQQALTLPLNGRHPSRPNTAATSETLYALTPDPGAQFRHINAANHFWGKNLAGAVPGAFMMGNHAEQKLIFHGGYSVRNIGVDRNTCQSCVNVICAHAAHIEHVSEPSGTYRVTPRAMCWVGF